MVTIGSDPIPPDFQSGASTKLASLPGGRVTLFHMIFTHAFGHVDVPIGFEPISTESNSVMLTIAPKNNKWWE